MNIPKKQTKTLKTTTRVLASKRRRSSKNIGLLRFKFIDLLFTVHGNDERNNKYKKTGSGDPCCFAGATEKLFGDDGGIGGGFFRVADDRVVANPSDC